MSPDDAFIEEELVPWFGARVLRGEDTQEEAMETLNHFRQLAHWREDFNGKLVPMKAEPVS